MAPEPTVDQVNVCETLAFSDSWRKIASVSLRVKTGKGAGFNHKSQTNMMLSSFVKHHVWHIPIASPSWFQ